MPSSGAARGVLITSGLLSLAVLTLCLGVPRLTPLELLDALRGAGPAGPHVIVTQVRLPRLALAIGCGAALGVAGVLLQGALHNALAGPELTGSAGGAALAVAGTVVFAPATPFAVYPLLALVGAVLATVVCVAAAGRRAGPLGLALIGSAVSTALAGLLVALVTTTDPSRASVVLRYMFGSLAARTWREAEACLPLVVLGVVVALFLGPTLNALRLGRHEAAAVGVHVRLTSLIAVAVAGLLVGAATAAAGLVAWIGLLAPHAARLAVGSDPRRTIPAAGLLGALLVTLADLLARTLAAPVELPLGAFTAFLAVGGGALLMLGPRRRVTGRNEAL